ncbi:MAG: hypothetical protein K2M36_04445, partial [Clostridia bacterium]|nr:hypothetical protein [Clostridia bacterium]
FYNGITLDDEIALRGEKAQVLAISSLVNDGIAAGYASESVTLNANNYYQLSVYVKTVGATTASVFLTGEASATGSNLFIINSTATNGDWTKYTFYIEVGNASASVKLNLWLGRDVEHINVEGDTAEDREKNAKSNGAVFFDSVIYKTIDEETYNTAVENETNQKITFITDSFDSLSNTIESRSTLSTPNGWTGVADTNQSASNTKYGIIYADSNYYETEVVDGVEYAKILGKEYKTTDKEFDVDNDELAEAKASGKYENMEDSDIIAALKDEKVLNAQKENWIPVSELYTRQQKENPTSASKRMLIINNTVKSAYRYTSSSTTLKENSFYKVSVWVRTYGLQGDDDTSGANVELYLGSKDESDKPLIFSAINTFKAATEEGGNPTNDWTCYTFYVKTLDDNVTNVSIRLSLGKYSSENIDGENVARGLTSGYAMFDDVTIEKITEDEFDGIEVGEDDKTVIK